MGRIAVLVDGDGISPRDAELALKHISEAGRLCILRIYRNLSEGTNGAWTTLIKRHGAVARHMPSLAPGKNGTDIALAIDAIEILFTGSVDTFVLVTNDADFAPLARRIREDGREVIGFGRSATVSFRNACTSFFHLRALATPSTLPVSPTELWSREPIEAETMMTTALSDLGWEHHPLPVNDLGPYLADRHPGFDCRVYRRRTLTDLLRDLPSVELIDVDGRKCARPSQSWRRTG